MIGVYKITNIINGKVYIGESMNIEERWNEHEKELKCGNHHSYKLQKDYNTYGKDNFKFEVLEEIDKDLKPIIQKCLLYILEDKYIKQYNSINKGYNVENTLELILKGDKSVFEGAKVSKKNIKILHNLINNINNNGIYIPSNNAIKDNKDLPKINKNIEKGSKTKIDKVNIIYDNDDNINYIITKCSNYLFKEKFMKLSDVLKDNNFKTGNTYQLLRDIGILNIDNKFLIKDSGMFEFRYNKIPYINQKGFIFLLNKILKYAKDNNTNIFTWKFINEILSM